MVDVELSWHDLILSTSSWVSFRTVVELGRPQVLLRRHFLCVIERAAIGVGTTWPVIWEMSASELRTEWSGCSTR
jgi:hypothetical protein